MTAALEIREPEQELRRAARSRATSICARASGARHALIGPNGAGKTTLVNLITGVLRAVARAASCSTATTSPALPQAARTRRGLARTFQINPLFRGLTVLENVYLAVAERTAPANRLWRPAGAERAVIEEALGLLDALAPRRRRAQAGARTCPMAASGWSRSRSRWRSVRRCCCSTSRPPACRRRKAISILDVIERARPDIAILIIEHDMDLVFRFASAHHRAGRRRGAVGGHAGRDRRRRARARRLSRRGSRARPPWLSGFALELDSVSAGYGETVVLEDIALALARARRSRSSAATASARPRCSRPSWATPRCMAAPSACAAHDIARLRAAPARWAGIGYVPQEREIFPSLTVRENLEVAARPGPWTLDERLRPVSAARRARRRTAATSSPAASSRCWRSAAR